MMRPLFCRIIDLGRPRASSGTTPRRFVSITWSQSSSFIRTSSWSRVMPALLTSTSMRPKRSRVASTSRSQSSRFAASADDRQRRRAQRLQLLAPRARDGPRRGQRLPRRRRPRPATRAMARPMPRLPPVTIATLPASGLASVTRAASAAERAAAVLSSDAGSSTACPRASSSVRLSSPVSTRPGPDLERTRSAPSRGEPLARSRSSGPGSPPGGRRNGFTSSAVRGDARVHVADDRARAGRATATPLELGGEAVGGRLHQRAVEGRAHRQQHALPAAARRGRAHRALHRRAMPGDDDLARRVDVGHPDHLALRGLRADAARPPASSTPMSAAIAPVPTGTASCMNSPRLRTSRTASAKRSAPATTSAEYSPRLWPAARPARRPRSAQRGGGRHARGQHRGLGVGGQRQVGLRALEAEAREREAERLVGLLARPRRRRASVSAKRLAHPDRLRALAGEEERDGHRRVGYHRRAPRPR